MSFSIDEIFEIAIQIERNGVEFYARAARLVDEPGCHRLLDELAAMEEDHIVTFEGMRDAAKAAGAAAGMVDAEMLAHLRAMADGHVFDTGIDPKAILTGEETLEEILSTAIGLEKESVVYYVAMKEVVIAEATQQRVQAIIHEEMDHIAQLSAQRSALT